MDHKGSHRFCYATLSHPSMKEAVALHNLSILKLAALVSEFAQQMAGVHEFFSKEIQSIVATFRKRNSELRKQRPVDTPNCIFSVWEALLQETELDAQAHMDAASLLLNNVYRPLQEVASHKNRQADMLVSFRENFDSVLNQTIIDVNQAESKYHNWFQEFQNLPDNSGPEGEQVRGQLHNCHNQYILGIRATNRTVDEFNRMLPQILEELEEIYIDTGNTINVAIESQALVLLTKANEQHRRYEDQLKLCKQVSPHQDVTFFVKAAGADNPALAFVVPYYAFKPAATLATGDQRSLCHQLIRDRLTETCVLEKRAVLQTQGMQLAAKLKKCQDVISTLSNACQRNLARHQYATVYETQLEMCKQRNEIRLANLQLTAIKAQIEMLTPKQNGYLDGDDGETEEEKNKHTASIKGMWKKAFRSLKSNDKPTLQPKKGSSVKRKDSEEEEEPQTVSREIDPVYSLLKSAADLPKAPKAQKDGSSSSHLSSKGEGSDSTSKASSPSSSASHSPKTRRKKLNARMKSFSLDTPDPPKQLLGIDEMPKKKSSSFTNNCFAGQSSAPPPASKKRFGFSMRSTSLEIEDAKRRSRSTSPQLSPKSKKKEADVYVSLYHFRGKEKDDMDLRPGSRVTVTNSSDPDWWKGKCSGRSGYFPAKYLLKLQKYQRVYQVTTTMNLTEIDGLGGLRLHKDQIVLGVGEIEDNTTVIHVKAANNREAMCPAQFLAEV